MITEGTILDFEATPDGLFWSTGEAIYRADHDGQNTTVLTSASFADHLAVEGQQVVWMENHPREVRLLTIPVDGGEAVELTRHEGELAFGYALALSPDNVFWLADGAIRKTDRRSGQSATLTDYPGIVIGPHALSLDATHVYYMIGNLEDDDTGSTIRRIAMDGEKTQGDTLAHGPLFAMAVQSDHVYASQAAIRDEQGKLSETARVFRMPAAGGPQQTLSDRVHDPFAVVASDIYVYWLDVVATDTLTDFHVELWRTRSDGDGAPQQVLQTDSLGVQMRLAPPRSPGEPLFWLGACEQESASPTYYVLRSDLR